MYKQICQLKPKDDCYKNMLKFLRVLEIEKFKYDEESIKELILNKIQERISKTKVTNVVVAESLEQKYIDKLIEFKLP